MLRAKTRFGDKKKLTLQLTSLLDMFTIILVFLMVSFQSSDEDFVLHAGVVLPGSSAKSPFKPGVNMAVTHEGVYVDGKKIYALISGGKVTDEAFESGKVEQIVEAVASTWEKQKKEKDAEQIVLVQADKGLPYRTIHLVMKSAAHAGFYRFRLAVEKE